MKWKAFLMYLVITTLLSFSFMLSHYLIYEKHTLWPYSSVQYEESVCGVEEFEKAESCQTRDMVSKSELMAVKDLIEMTTSFGGLDG